MRKVISHLFHFIKQLFLRLRLVVTLSIGRDMENEDDNGPIEERSEKEESK